MFDERKFLIGSPWRDMRAKLSPSFTSGRMKMYFPMIMDVVKELLSILDKKAANKEVIDAKVTRTPKKFHCACAKRFLALKYKNTNSCAWNCPKTNSKKRLRVRLINF